MKTIDIAERVARWDAVSFVWRAVLSGFFHSRPMRFLLLAAVVGGVVVGAAGQDGSSASSLVTLLLTVALGGGLVRGVISDDRKQARWILLFQRPVKPHTYYIRLLLVSILALLALLLVVGFAATVTAWYSGAEVRRIWGGAAGAALLGVNLVIVGTAISSLVKRHDVELLLLLFFVSMYQGVFTGSFESALVRNLMEFLLLPVNPILSIWNHLSSGDPLALTGGWVAHLVFYPLIWLLVTRTVVGGYGRRDLPIE